MITARTPNSASTFTARCGIAMLLLSAAPAYAFNCNFLRSHSGEGVATLIGAGETVIDGGPIDGWATDWCSVGHLTVAAGGAIYNGRFPSALPSGLTTFQNGELYDSYPGVSDSSLTNQGTVQNGAFGVFVNNVSLTNYGALNNLGTMTNTGRAGFINNLATFNNSGMLTLDAPEAPGRIALSNAGALVNSGSLSNGGNILNSAGGTLDNAGTLTNLGSVVVDAYSTLNNGLLGRASFSNRSLLQIAGTLENYGALTNETDASLLVLYGAVLNNNGALYTQFVNNGLIKNSGRLNLWGSYEFQNNGRLVNEATLVSASVLEDGKGILNNNAGGTLWNSGYLESDSLSNYGRINNDNWLIVHGTLTNVGVVSSGGRLISDGNLNNTSSGVLTIVPGGRLDINASMRNDGTWTNNAGQVWVGALAGSSATVQGAGGYSQTGAAAATVVNGTLEQSFVTIAGGGSLQGSGVVHAPVTINGATLAPGPYGDLTIERPLGGRHARFGPAAIGDRAPGTLTIDGDLDFVDGTLLLEIAGTGAGEFDMLHVTGHAGFAAGTLKLAFVDGFLPAVGDHWLLLQFDGGVAGLDRLVADYAGLAPGYAYAFTTQLTDHGVDIGLASVTSIPEPGSSGLMIAGLGLLCAWLAKRRRGAASSATADRPPKRAASSKRAFAMRMGLPVVFLCAALPATACDLVNLVYPFFDPWDPVNRVIPAPNVVINVNPIGCNRGGTNLEIERRWISPGWEVATLRNEGGLYNETSATIYNFGIFDSPGTFRNDGLLDNYSSLQLLGATVNNGTMNTTGDYLDFPPVQVRISGSFVNNADFYSGGATVSIQGAFDNSAAGHSAFNGGTLEIADGTLNNSGTMRLDGATVQNGTAANSAALLNNSGQMIVGGGRINNLGTIENTGYIYHAGVSLLSTGTFTNRGDYAVLSNSSGSTFTTTGQLSNNGRILNSKDVGGPMSTMVIAGAFVHDGSFVNSQGNVVFTDTSSTTGIGTYTQTGSDSLTQLDGGVHIARIDLFGGRLCGNGSTSGTLLTVDGGTICPGHSPGTLTLGDLDFVDGVLELQIAGTAAGQFDVLIIGGRASFAAGTLDIQFIDGFLPLAGDQWQLLVFGGEVTGLGHLAVTFEGLPEGFTLAFTPDGTVRVLTAVPEPGSSAMALVGLACIAFAVRRRSVAPA